MTKDQLHAHLEALAEIADLAQRDPQEALDRSLASKPQPGARELHVAVVLYCQFLRSCSPLLRASTPKAEAPFRSPRSPRGEARLLLLRDEQHPPLR